MPPSIRFPFLGVREGGEPFEYLLIETAARPVTIAISKWFVNYALLNLQERIELFSPFYSCGSYKPEESLKGVVTARKEIQDIGEWGYHIALEDSSEQLISIQEEKNFHSKAFGDSFSLQERLLHLLKESLILKEGLMVYLNHFAPYFSRIVNLPKRDYTRFEKWIFKDILEHIKKNSEKLKELYTLLKTSLKDIEDLSLYLNLDDLRKIVESEINLDLFLLAFNSEETSTTPVSLFAKLEQKKVSVREEYYIYYLLTIKNLEKKLYFNYNQIVLIYTNSLNFSVEEPKVDYKNTG